MWQPPQHFWLNTAKYACTSNGTVPDFCETTCGLLKNKRSFSYHSIYTSLIFHGLMNKPEKSVKEVSLFKTCIFWSVKQVPSRGQTSGHSCKLRQVAKDLFKLMPSEKEKSVIHFITQWQGGLLTFSEPPTKHKHNFLHFKQCWFILLHI